MKTYLQQTKFKTYKYIRRIPKELLNYTNKSTFRVSLGSNQLEATQTALEYNNAIDEALQLLQMGLDRATILSKLSALIPASSQTAEASKQVQQGLFLDLAEDYLSSQEQNISKEETRDKGYFYRTVCTSIFSAIGLDYNPIIKGITYNHLLQFKAKVVELPKRNIQRYRSMELSEILNHLEEVTSEDKISARTINKYIKWLRALFNFSVMLNHLQVNLASSLPLQKTLDDKLQRLPLSESELSQLLQSLPQKMKYLVKVLAHTGMRLSELYKCEVVELEGIKCFSLMDRELKLKTKSSYRVIPVHHQLLEQLDSFEEQREGVSSDNLARTTSATIKTLDFVAKEKKSLYSLRHSFATRLIQADADTAIVSELLGHTHSTMTLSRYSTGFSVSQLQKVVKLL